MTQIIILTASCPSDFSERDMIVVGLTEQGASAELKARLAQRWENKEPKDQEFWEHDFDKYYESWNINQRGDKLAS